MSTNINYLRRKKETIMESIRSEENKISQINDSLSNIGTNHKGRRQLEKQEITLTRSLDDLRNELNSITALINRRLKELEKEI